MCVHVWTRGYEASGGGRVDINWRCQQGNWATGLVVRIRVSLPCIATEEFFFFCWTGEECTVKMGRNKRNLSMRGPGDV